MNVRQIPSEYQIGSRQHDCVIVVPRLLANIVCARLVDTTRDDDVLIEVDFVFRPAIVVNMGTIFVPIVPRNVVSFKEMRTLIEEHSDEVGHPIGMATLDVAATIDWIAWCVLMGPLTTWRPTRDEQDPVWHRLIEKPYFRDMVSFFSRATSRYNGINEEMTIEHILRKVDVGVDRHPEDQQTILEDSHVPLAQFMSGRTLAECESAVRYAV